jgi:hypothetical protein
LLGFESCRSSLPFSGLYVAAATELTLGLRSNLTVEPLRMADYETAIGEARQRGVMDGGIHDSLQATFGRRKGAERVVTRNPAHVAHAAPDLDILAP